MATSMVCLVLCGFACGAVEGVVVDEAWRPVPDAAVLLVFATDSGWGDAVVERTASGEDGSFAFKHKSERKRGPKMATGGWPYYGVCVLHPDKGFAACRVARASQDFITAQLAPLQSHSFRVTDEEGRPVADADVFLCGGKTPQPPILYLFRRSFYPHADLGLCSGKTDADGAITIDGPTEAAWGIHKAGYVPIRRFSNSKGDTVLCRGARITGRVLDPSGNPLPKAIVLCRYLSSWACWDRAVRADEDGVYVFECAPTSGFRCGEDDKIYDGRTYLRAFDTTVNSLYVAGKAKLSYAAGEEVVKDISVQSRPVCTVCLTDANTGRPAANVNLRYYGEPDLGAPQDFMFTTDAAGKVQCPVLDTPVRFAISGGSNTEGYLLDPACRGSKRSRYDISFDAFKTPVHHKKIALLPTCKAKGKVKDCEGGLVAGALVYARLACPLGTLLDSRIESCLADARGRFVFDALPAGRAVTYFAFSQDGKQVGIAEARPGRKRVSVATKPCRTLHGQVVDREGNPLGGVRFNWAPVLSLYRGKAHANALRCRLDVEADEDGRFVIENVSPDLPYVASLNAHIGHEVPPLGGKDNITLTLRLFSRPLTGRLVDEEGKPVATKYITAPCSYMEARWDSYYKTDEEGCFTIERLPIGQTYLKIYTQDFYPALVSIAAGQEEVLVVLRKKGEHRYRVLNAGKKPLSGVEVVIHEFEDDAAASELAIHTVMSGDDGLAAFAVPQGSESHTFTAEFRAPGYPLAFVTVEGRIDRRTKEVEPTDCTVDVVLREHKPWAGRVVDGNGEPVPDAEVRVSACYYRSGTGARCPGLAEGHSDLIARTNTEGYWELPRLSQDDSIIFCVSAEGFKEERDGFTPDWINDRTTVLAPVE